MQPWYGFNFQWMFSWQPGQFPAPVNERALDFLVEFGFNFVRIPTDYRFWVRDFDYFHPNEKIFTHIDSYLDACQQRGLHFSLNSHRAPGYCINRNDLEKHNLWLDQEAQDAFVFLWETFARRYQHISAADLSFDLVNEPANIGQYGLTRANHAALVRRTCAAIRAIDSQRPIVIDGLGGGHLAMPELSDIGVIHSSRGYQPMPVSHHQAEWWDGHATAPAPLYPGLIWDGHAWDRDTLRAFYQPWREVQDLGVNIHVGEFGCYNRTPNEVALRWFHDLFSIYKEFGWGYALWEFKGPFGIAEHGRQGTRYETLHGFQIDRSLLELMLTSRVP